MASPQRFSTNLGLSTLPEVDDKKNPDVYAECLRIRNALRILQAALDSYTGALSEDEGFWSQANPAQTSRVQNISRVYGQASEDLSLGNAVNFFDLGGGKLGVRKAIASSTPLPCFGFCSTSGGVLAGGFTEVILLGMNSFFAGITPGTIYYLSQTTAGGYTITPPSLTGEIVQQVGVGVGERNFWFNPVLNWTVIP